MKRLFYVTVASCSLCWPWYPQRSMRQLENPSNGYLSCNVQFTKLVKAIICTFSLVELGSSEILKYIYFFKT